MIYLRKANLSDVADIMPIITQAREFLGNSGSDQWQAEYPAKTDIENFIGEDVGYVLVVDETVAGFCAVITGEDTQYTKIYDGSWLNDNLDYVTVHCLALSDQYRGRGLTKYLFSNIFTLMYARGYRDFRVDTHPANSVMQAVFEREGFEKRGMVFYEGDRFAYQLLLGE
ncbi:GNAT family N-acetyltransferase [Lactococcus garvieae]|uniref:GNAT family N-acetyltransferase n=1 Tax=Lactococcus garvieae TaxID=1363 RepID=UPI0009C030AB|nr:GNAT family N-acetyltransferase [Lactococcus garvieae]